MIPTTLSRLFAKSSVRLAAFALGGSLAIAVSAQVTVPLEPVPMTMQSLMVLLVGVAGGKRAGGLALLAYLAEGLIGLPVFANLRGGPAVLAGPTGGFLVGFVAAAVLAGWMAARGWTQGIWRPAVLMTAGHAVIFAAGLGWLATMVGWDRAVAVGLIPFLPGTAVKIALGVALVRVLRRV